MKKLVYINNIILKTDIWITPLSVMDIENPTRAQYHNFLLLEKTKNSIVGMSYIVLGDNIERHQKRILKHRRENE